MIARRGFIIGGGAIAARALSPLEALAQAPATPNELHLVDRSVLEPPPANFSSNHNYFIHAGGQPIRGLSVTIAVTEDLDAPTGLNMQLNCNSADGATCVYQQYCMGIDPKFKTRLGWSNENFPSREFRWVLHQKHDLPCGAARNPTEESCKGDIFNMHGVVGFFPRITNRVPAGSKLVWELIENPDGAIAGASYSFVNPDGKKTSSGPQLIKSFRLEGGKANVDPDAMVPILSLQMNIVGLNGGAHTQLGSGAGSIIYQAMTPLVPSGKQPQKTAAHGVFTAESSNINYAELAAQPKMKVVQRFRAL